VTNGTGRTALVTDSTVISVVTDVSLVGTLSTTNIDVYMTRDKKFKQNNKYYMVHSSDPVNIYQCMRLNYYRSDSQCNMNICHTLRVVKP